MCFVMFGVMFFEFVSRKSELAMKRRGVRERKALGSDQPCLVGVRKCLRSAPTVPTYVTWVGHGIVAEPMERKNALSSGGRRAPRAEQET